LKITMSIGIAVYNPQIDKTSLSIVHRADEAMYQAKRSGGNSICWAQTAQLQLQSNPDGGIKT
jgi:GGDEF domain-containing protein